MNKRYSPRRYENIGLCDSFSLPHVVAYTAILMIEMNMCYRYGAEYWKTACLTINAGIEGELDKGADYGTISKAVNSMKEDIELPDVNISGAEFIPTENGKTMFGLKPIIGLGSAAIETVIKNRPYSSVEDFYKKNVESGEMPVSKAIVLVKSGSFNNISGDARSAAIELTNCHIKPKEKLTTTQLPKILHLARKEKPELKEEFDLFELRSKIKGRTKVPMNKEIEAEFMKYSNDIEYSFDDNGLLKIDEKSFDKYFNKNVKEMKDWLKTEQATELLCKVEKRQFWIDNFLGTKEEWEMETTMFYSDKHEVDYIDFLKDIKISNFKEMEQEKVKSTYKTRSGTIRSVFEVETIVGTVVDKSKQKSLVYLLTQYGVVTVRVPKFKFGMWDRKVVDIDSEGNKTVKDVSWFERGTKLLCTGYRRGEEFVLYKNNKDSKELYKIDYDRKSKSFYLIDHKEE